MKRKIILLFVFVLFLVSFQNRKKELFVYPKTWPKPEYNFSNNPLDSNKIKIGRALFYDPKLSKDGTISCASCHLQSTGFTHIDHQLSHGINGRIGKRNSISLVNLAWSKRFMWDGSIHHLDVQPLAPISSEDEMGSSIQQVVQTLRKSNPYKKSFEKAFGDTLITGERVLKSLSQFCLTLVSYNAKYDQVMAKKKGVLFTELEQKGYALFKAKCNNCHAEPLFTNYTFQNNGNDVDTSLNDFGRMIVSHKSQDSLHFKVPTLRNIEVTYPYMHDGRFANLQMVLFHYSTNNSMRIEMNEQEKKALIAFLKTLTDESFLRNKEYSYMSIE